MANTDVSSDAILRWAKADPLAPLMIPQSATSIRPSQVPKTFRFSSIGFLHLLPVELLQDILDLLDFRSLTRFLRTSHRAKTAVERLPAYRDLIRCASSTLNALVRTKTIKLHSAGSLHAALRSEKCVACGNYGPYLSLLTCQRICWEELYYNPSHWLLSLAQAKRCLGLGHEDLDRIPSLLTIPGDSSDLARPQRSERLVSFKAAKQLGIAVHGTQEAMSSFVASTWANPNQSQLGTQLSRGEECLPNLPIDRIDMRQGNGEAAFAIELWIGRAQILFPSISRSESSYGFSCCGCWTTLEKVMREGYFDRTTALQLSLWRRRWSKSEFMEHVVGCEGMTELFSGSVPLWMYEKLRRWGKLDPPCPVQQSNLTTLRIQPERANSDPMPRRALG